MLLTKDLWTGVLHYNVCNMILKNVYCITTLYGYIKSK